MSPAPSMDLGESDSARAKQMERVWDFVGEFALGGDLNWRRVGSRWGFS